MSISDSDLIVIDTNALVHWIRQDATGKRLLSEYALEKRSERPLLATIVEGELLGLARCWNWGTAKLDRLEEILAELVRVDVGHSDIVRVYAELYFWDRKTGRNTGENDLWIAATTKATCATLLTCDSDFDWMMPDHVNVEIVSQIR
jgi:tRNA(fMet)-specific endonuclease VapC